MGCNFSRLNRDEHCHQDTNGLNEDQEQAHLDEKRDKKGWKKPSPKDGQGQPLHGESSKKKSKKKKPDNENKNVGNKLATSNEHNESPPQSSVASVSTGNGSVPLPSVDSVPPIPPLITPDRLYKNFQDRLSTQTAKTGTKLTDSQLEFFRMLDDKINQGRDYESEGKRDSITVA